MNTLTTSHEFTKVIKVSSFSYMAIGAMCSYLVGDRHMHFFATPEQMASELKKQWFIERYSIEQGQFVVEIKPSADDEEYTVFQSLEEYMKQFSQMEWIRLLSNFEAAKVIAKEVMHANDPSISKYHFRQHA